MRFTDKEWEVQFYREGWLNMAKEWGEHFVTSADGLIDLAVKAEQYVVHGVTPQPTQHLSDCAAHNEPAMPAGPCDCDAQPART